MSKIFSIVRALVLAPIVSGVFFHSASAYVAPGSLSDTVPQTFFKRDISVSAVFDKPSKLVKFRLSVPRSYFSEGTMLKLAYSENDPAVAYDGTNWIWYSTENANAVSYALEGGRWIPGEGNAEFRPVWKE